MYEKETIYEKTNSIILFLMQSYGEFGLIPRNCAISSSTCMDNGLNFGQIKEIRRKNVQR